MLGLRKKPDKTLPGLKRTGLRIALTHENCDVKPYTFEKGGNDNLPTSGEILDGLVGRKSINGPEDGSYIVMLAEINGNQHRFISHPINMDPIMVRLKLEQTESNLYVDSADPNKFCFDLQF